MVYHAVSKRCVGSSDSTHQEECVVEEQSNRVVLLRDSIFAVVLDCIAHLLHFVAEDREALRELEWVNEDMLVRGVIGYANLDAGSAHSAARDRATLEGYVKSEHVTVEDVTDLLELLCLRH